MKVSWAWLGELADLGGLEAEQAAHLLPLRVADVEGVERRGGLDGVVTARVLKVEPHPGADRLRLCTVDVGASNVFRVVCGAQNVAEGQAVCFAKVGTTLPNGLTLKRAKIRGVESEGMICAEDELGLGTDHAGIVVLPDATPAGRPAAEALGLSDVVIDVNNAGITNRPDLWGHAGVAREVAAAFRRDLRLPSLERPLRLAAAAAGDRFPVAIEDPEGCRRYLALVVEGVANGASPARLRRRLEAVGLHSVDLLVDLTNVVMLEQGQPLHAFDLREVRGGRIVVRRAREAERLRLLDGREVALAGDDLLVADAERPLAIAGVMGGEASGVRADTTAILLESACFAAVRVRRTATRHGLRTDASARFEKSLDPEGARTAALRFLDLLVEHVPTARLARPPTDVFPRPYPPVEIDLPFDLVRRRLGWPVDDARIVADLVSIGFRCDPRPGGARVRVPSWRATKDVSIPEDLVEEVGRLEGYEHVVPAVPEAPMSPRRPSPERSLERDGRAVLSLGLGYAEIATYAFHGEKEARRLRIDPECLVRLAHPISAEQDRLQATCGQNLLVAAARNQPREATLRLCEWTRVFPVADRASASPPAETAVVGILRAERDRKEDPRGETFLEAKEDVLSFLARVGVAGASAFDAGDASIHDLLPPPAWLHPGRRAAIRAGDVVLAVVGEVSARVREEFGLEGTVATGEVNLARVLATGRPGVPYRPLPRFPLAPFDVSVIVPRRTPAAEVERALRGSAPEAVREVRVFDVYEGAGIPSGHRSLALTVTFGDDAGTLAPKALERLQARALEALGRAGWTVRTADGTPPAGT